jgi:peptide/nickel transport system permease protein
MPATLFLAGAAILIALPLGLLLGAGAAARPGSHTERAVNLLSLASVSTVEFWAGLILILVFALHLGLLPTSGFGGVEFVILPALTLALRPMGRITQITRESLTDEVAKLHISAARSRGVPGRRLFFVHSLKNAAPPIVTLSGDELVALLTGVIIVEWVFAWPGVGALLIDALTRRDLPLVEASIFVLALMAIVVNVVVDASYSRLDPRVKLR